MLTVSADACGGKDVWVLEAGWPSAGQTNGAAVPGASEQATAVKSMVDAAGDKIAVFTYTDDLWKTPGPMGVETAFGCSQLFA